MRRCSWWRWSCRGSCPPRTRTCRGRCRPWRFAARLRPIRCGRGAVGDRELPRRDAGEHFGKLGPGAVEVFGMNVIGTVELPRCRADLGVPPAQVADAPAHHEVDVLAAAGVGEMAVGRAADDDVLRVTLAAKIL